VFPSVYRFLPLLIRGRDEAARRPSHDEVALWRGPIDPDTTLRFVQAGQRFRADCTGQLGSVDARRAFEHWHRRVIAEELLDVISVSGDEAP
jgi:hypothetical protein